MRNINLPVLFVCLCVLTSIGYSEDVRVTLSENAAVIENRAVSMSVDLSNGRYRGYDKAESVVMFKEAVFLLDPGITRQWKAPKTQFIAEDLGRSKDCHGEGQTLRIWQRPDPSSHDPESFLDITLYRDRPFTVLGWGVKNPFTYAVRVCRAEILMGGKIFVGQEPSHERVLRGGAGAESNHVEKTWKIDAHNSAMLTYVDARAGSRRTVVAGGLGYAEFMRHVAFQEGTRKFRHTGSHEFENPEYVFVGKDRQMTLTVRDPQGKRVPPGALWKSEDTVYLDFVTPDPFVSLEQFGEAMAAANDAAPNKYDFPTLCGWAVGALGEGTRLNHSPGLVEQMDLAVQSGVLTYTPVALRLEPDYYCYSNFGDTQQGWWDDAHWAKYGSLRPPYETFRKFADAVTQRGGVLFTYFQGSLPSNDFAQAHPNWMLNNDISRLHMDHAHHRPPVRYDYTDPEFQNYVLAMWKRLGQEGVEGIKFDYPETAWNTYGGFEDRSHTTVSAYRKLFQLCRDGLGPDAYIHERIIGNPTHEKVPRTDVCAGIVDLQRVWGDASHFEPEMASRIGLRWYKQGKVFRYYPDSKSLTQHGRDKTPLTVTERRTLLTLVGLLSGRLELATSFGRMTPEILHDLTRIFPVLPNGQAFRPVDMLLGKAHPETYVYDVTDDWKQVILVNNDARKPRLITAPLSGDQAETGSIGFDADREYEVFDFWNQTYLGCREGSQSLSVELKPLEALVYTVRQKRGHPRVIGTSRHVMCGMLDVSGEKWNKQDLSLSFRTGLVPGETEIITVSLPASFKAALVTAPGAETRIEEKQGVMTLCLLPHGDAEVTVEVKIEFKI